MQSYALALAWLVLGLVGCAGSPNQSHPRYAPVEPLDYAEDPVVGISGGLYDVRRSLSLFSDTRAFRKGDIVSVVLTESTTGTKSSDTELEKSTSISLPNPTVFGRAFNARRPDNLSIEASGSRSFAGDAVLNQRNSLTGSIAVQVASVLPNGNLVIQGEKWININQGDEYIRLRGIIRPQDLSAGNTISSTLVADARIAYSGTGVGKEANTPGWLARFFTSPLMPF
jgi:flagellar L-ring protein precursor FlgH